MVTDNPTEIVLFEEVSQFERGTRMWLRLNRVGFEVREYPVELKGTMFDWGERLIICRLSPETGQMVIAGDSGSPLLTEDDRVAGAVCYGVLGDPYIFMARAIEDVLSLTAENEVGTRSYQGQHLVPIPPAYYLTVPGDTDRIKRWLRNNGLCICQVSAAAIRQTGEPALIPGNSISVNEITGYLINGGYVGTVSYMNDNKIYTFGHSLYRTGDTAAVPATRARMIDIITGLISFKLALPAGANIGAATIDRNNGVVIENVVAETTPVATTIRVGDETSPGNCYLHRVARFKGGELEQTLLLTALVYPADFKFDQISSGSAHGTLTLQVEGEDEQTFAIDLPGEIPPPDDGVSVEQEESAPANDIVWAVADAVQTRIAEVARPGRSFVAASLDITISDQIPEISPGG